MITAKQKKIIILGKVCKFRPVNGNPDHAKCRQCGELSRLHTLRIHRKTLLGTWCKKCGWRMLKKRTLNECKYYTKEKK